jgi:hypothetical protein
MSDSVVYSHTQPGTLVRVLLGGFTVVLLLMLIFLPGPNPTTVIVGVVLVLFVAAVLIFHSLRVQVSAHEVSIQFGIGVIKKCFPIAQIRSAEQVKNKWYYGWGIRWLPGGWLYNVSGMDAVELVMADGKKVRIGTDDPDGLLAAIESVT